MNEPKHPARGVPPEAAITQPIDLLEYLYVLRSKLVWILLCGVIAGFAGYYKAAYRTTPIYEASINLIVNADTEAATVVTISDVHSAASLVDTYAVIIKSNRVLDRVIEAMSLPMNWVALNGKVTVSSVNQTSVMRVAVRDSDPDRAMRIVLKISEIAPDILVQAVKAGSCEIVSDAYCSGYPISPNVRSEAQRYAVIGAAACAALVVLLHLLKNTVSSEEELSAVSDLPVLGMIPDIDTFSRKERSGAARHKGGY